jgi:hypothetical protein
MDKCKDTIKCQIHNHICMDKWLNHILKWVFKIKILNIWDMDKCKEQEVLKWVKFLMVKQHLHILCHKIKCFKKVTVQEEEGVIKVKAEEERDSKDKTKTMVRMLRTCNKYSYQRVNS